MERKEFIKGFFFFGGTFLKSIHAFADKEERGRVLRPPGFIHEKGEECGGCASCCTACPGGLLHKRPYIPGPLLIPEKEGCRFCYLCAGACPQGVIVFPLPEEQVRIGTAEINNDTCLAKTAGCFACVDHCPEKALALRPGKGLVIDRTRCTGCGICESICPVGDRAIEVVPF